MLISGNAENANPARDSDPPRAGGLWVVQKNVVTNSGRVHLGYGVDVRGYGVDVCYRH